mmetsp:Transcript_14311/g.40713  ORF Transcript_14311/g.40713 Transcript_14311/m.40713 type:complete len:210 (+) Transcript_14311:58-687(+)
MLDICPSAYVLVDQFVHFVLSHECPNSFRLVIQLHHGRQTFHQRRMGVMITRIVRIGTHGTQILQMDLAQSTLQGLAHAKIHRKAISRKFAMSREHRQDEAQDFVDGCPQCLEEEHQRNDAGDGLGFIIKAEGCVEIAVGVAQREEVECRSEVDLCDEEVGQGVPQLPMAEFMSKDCQDFVVVHLFQQRVEQNNTLVTSKTKHESIGMR